MNAAGSLGPWSFLLVVPSSAASWCWSSPGLSCSSRRGCSWPPRAVPRLVRLHPDGTGRVLTERDVLSNEVRAATAPLASGYADLLARVVDASRDDQRVRALWLSGSVGRGVADAGSDLDLVVTVSDRAAFADASSWDVLDPVITVPIPGLPGLLRVHHARGAAGRRRAGDARRTSRRRRTRPGAGPGPRRSRCSDTDAGTSGHAGRGPDAGDRHRVPAPVRDLPGRGGRARGLAAGSGGRAQLRRMLYDLFVESNQPLPSWA